MHFHRKTRFFVIEPIEELFTPWLPSQKAGVAWNYSSVHARTSLLALCTAYSMQAVWLWIFCYAVYEAPREITFMHAHRCSPSIFAAAQIWIFVWNWYEICNALNSDALSMQDYINHYIVYCNLVHITTVHDSSLLRGRCLQSRKLQEFGCLVARLTSHKMPSIPQNMNLRNESKRKIWSSALTSEQQTQNMTSIVSDEYETIEDMQLIWQCLWINVNCKEEDGGLVSTIASGVRFALRAYLCWSIRS